MGERRASEADFARRWAAGEWRGWLLHAEQDEQYRLIFQGRRGGPVGPDFRDAILERADGARIRGDVELHLEPGGWYAHAHATDPRYNAVALHVTLRAGPRRVTAVPLASGQTPPQTAIEHALSPQGEEARWPCERLSGQIDQAAVRRLLLDAGWTRFASHAETFKALLLEGGCSRGAHDARSDAARMLTVALAEGLGYGGDRALLQSIGQRLVSGESPSVLRADGAVWPRVERARLDGLLALWERWEPLGPWKALEPLVGATTARAAARGMIEALVVRPGLISPGRAAILTANVALPFAAAWASLIDDAALGVSARGAYSALPGLPSNQITREMMRQLGLPRSPVGAIAQQGLQHIWNEHCRDKRCAMCPCAIALHATHERPLPARESGRSCG